MKPRTTLILAVILVVLAAVATIFETNKRKARQAEGEAVFPAYSMDKADTIRIAKGGQLVELAKDGGIWTVATEGGHEAEPNLVNQILEAVDQFQTTTLVSRSPERREAFEVDAAGTEVRITGDGQELAAFVAGKPGPDFMSTYIRPVDRDEVYQVPVYLRNMVDRGDQSWRKMTILDLEQDDIVGYTTRNPRETVTVEKGPEGEWLITEPIQARTQAQIMPVVLNSMTRIRAADFPDSALDLAAAGIEPDTTTLTIRTVDGSTHKLIIGASDERNRSYTMLEGDPTIYLVPRGRWNTVFRPLDTIRMPEPEPAGEDAAEGNGEAGDVEEPGTEP